MNDTFFKNIHISNFKSLKEVTLSDCKRINLLIGKPNVGKSNILEAIGLFSLPYFKYNVEQKITQFIRVEDILELFFDANIHDEIFVYANNKQCMIRHNTNNFQEVLSFKIELDEDTVLMSMDNSFELKIHNLLMPPKEFFHLDFESSKNDIKKLLEEIEYNKDDINKLSIIENKINSLKMKTEAVRENYYSKVKYYKFLHTLSANIKKVELPYLLPPIGVNILRAIEINKIDKELSKIFSEYGLKLLSDKISNSLRVMKETKDGSIISLPLSSIADTLQRLIFFKTAIASNENSILLFEEPEAHCFPPYIAHFTQDVINHQTNQYFIATHSPYVLNDFLENQRNEVAIFIADFKDGQTVIYRLTDYEVNEVYNDGIDVFFNYEKYTQHG